MSRNQITGNGRIALSGLMLCIVTVIQVTNGRVRFTGIIIWKAIGIIPVAKFWRQSGLPDVCVFLKI